MQFLQGTKKPVMNMRSKAAVFRPSPDESFTAARHSSIREEWYGT